MRFKFALNRAKGRTFSVWIDLIDYQGTHIPSTPASCIRGHMSAADNIGQQPPPPANMNLRSGGWTTEEEAYASHVTRLFLQGKVPNCPDGTTLRTLLASLLNCLPMRVSTKYGKLPIGKKRGYCHSLDETLDDETIVRRGRVVRALARRLPWAATPRRAPDLGRVAAP